MIFEDTMGFWKSTSKFACKLAERAMLIVCGLQWGDSANDSEKISNALVQYEGKRSLFMEEKSETLKYTVIILALFIFDTRMYQRTRVECYKVHRRKIIQPFFLSESPKKVRKRIKKKWLLINK